MDTYVQNLGDLLQGCEIRAQQEHVMAIQIVWKR